MRLIYTFKDIEQGKLFASYLNSKEISAQVEMSTQRDWGSQTYGDLSCEIWVTDEDDIKPATKDLERFLADPKSAEFMNVQPKITASHSVHSRPNIQLGLRKQVNRIPKPMGPVTLYILLACVWIFVWANLTTPTPSEIPTNIPLTPILTSPIQKELLYDYPEKYILIDKAVSQFGYDEVLKPAELPPAGQQLLVKALKTPIWTGYYSYLLDFAKGKPIDWTPDAPVFERIRDGEFWRSFTPCLLHSDIFHILFNMIWLVVLGKQMEKRLGVMRYITFIILAGLLSNLSQYLMSGSNFIGFSGVVCAMITYIWFRQKKAPWEGYQLQGATMGMITVFVLGIFLLQLASFMMEVYFDQGFTPGIANTAHISGGLIGILFSRISFFLPTKG